MRFFWLILLPLSRANVAAMLVVMFVYGWNQFLWPLLVTTRPEMSTIVMGVMKLMPGMDSRPLWNQAMAAGVLATLPPVAVVLVLQRWFVQGLVEAEK
jgi:sn-glycerol 3-phosphate transport system permease protein